MKTVLQVIVFILLVDVICFCMWSISGQIPEGNFYLGSITSHLI